MRMRSIKSYIAGTGGGIPVALHVLVCVAAVGARVSLCNLAHLVCPAFLLLLCDTR